MYTDLTYQDYLQSPDRRAFLTEAVTRYQNSAFFRDCLTATAYFRGRNTTVAHKTILRARRVETRDARGRSRSRAELKDVVGNRVGS